MLAYMSSLAVIKGMRSSYSRQTNLCTLTGKSGSYQRLFGLSRHTLKRKAEFGLVQNLRSRSW